MQFSTPHGILSEKQMLKLQQNKRERTLSRNDHQVHCKKVSIKIL